MNVLLINPPYMPEERYGKDMAHFGPTTEPLGLAYLAGALEQAGHKVRIVDAMASGMSIKEIIEWVWLYIDNLNETVSMGISHEKKSWYDLIGITMLTPMYDKAKELIKGIKKEFPAIPIVVGGAHPTAMPEETLEDIPEIDYLVIGEGESTMPWLVKSLEENESFHGAKILTDDLIKDIDDIPLPSRHLLPMAAYQITASRNQGHHAYTVSVARGCPFNCGYCSRINGNKVRYHSVGRVIEEMMLLVDKYNAKEINLEADTLTLNKTFVHSLCKEIIATGLNKRVSWTCESRVDTVNYDMLAAMKEAGCWQISYGIESGTQRLLDFMQKGTNLDQIRKTIRITKDAGIGIRAFFMLGLPTETEEDSKQTISFAKELNAEWSQFTLFTPFPGTALYNYCREKEGWIPPAWSDFKTHGGWEGGKLAYVPEDRTEEEMKSLQKWAYREVYIRPRTIYIFLKKKSTWSNLPDYVRGFMTLLKSGLT